MKSSILSGTLLNWQTEQRMHPDSDRNRQAISMCTGTRMQGVRIVSFNKTSN
jgi:hypothetical protein